MDDLSIRVNSAEETQAFAGASGKVLRGGEVLALEGELGAGKTCFVQGLARGLGVPSSVYVCSPTYTLHDSYVGEKTLHHLDLYRLGDADELEEIGRRDYLDGQAIVAIEWANQLDDYLPPDFIEIRISIISVEGRSFSFRIEGEELRWLEQWLRRYPQY